MSIINIEIAVCVTEHGLETIFNERMTKEDELLFYILMREKCNQEINKHPAIKKDNFQDFNDGEKS